MFTYVNACMHITYMCNKDPGHPIPLYYMLYVNTCIPYRVTYLLFLFVVYVAPFSNTGSTRNVPFIYQTLEAREMCHRRLKIAMLDAGLLHCAFVLDNCFGQCRYTPVRGVPETGESSKSLQSRSAG
jgi:hypothetical protein